MFRCDCRAPPAAHTSRADARPAARGARRPGARHARVRAGWPELPGDRGPGLARRCRRGRACAVRARARVRRWAAAFARAAGAGALARSAPPGSPPCAPARRCWRARSAMPERSAAGWLELLAMCVAAGGVIALALRLAPAIVRSLRPSALSRTIAFFAVAAPTLVARRVLAPLATAAAGRAPPLTLR